MQLTARPGCWTMETNAESSASYLACTPRVPLFCTLLNRGGNRRGFWTTRQGRDHFRCAVVPSPSHIRCRSFLTKEILGVSRVFSSFSGCRGAQESLLWGVPSDGLRRYGLSIFIKEIRHPKAFETRLKCICHEIALQWQDKPALGIARLMFQVFFLGSRRHSSQKRLHTWMFVFRNYFPKDYISVTRK